MSLGCQSPCLCPLTHTAAGSAARHFIDEETDSEGPQCPPQVTQLVRRKERVRKGGQLPDNRDMRAESSFYGTYILPPSLAWKVEAFLLLFSEETARVETHS